MPWLSDLVRPVVDYALPPRCPGCGAVVLAEHRFCVACWVQLDFLTGVGCARCSLPIALSDGGLTDGVLCANCLAAPPAYDGVRAAVAYGDIPRRVVLSLKYARQPGIAHTIAALIAPRLDPDPGGVLIPVPLHRWRLWSRGFNQSLAIARALSTRTHLPVVAETLTRKRATPVLRAMNPAQRRAAVRGVFAAAVRLDDAHVYLVDDVFTTGATADACARTLKRAGAARVTVICWARVITDD